MHLTILGSGDITGIPVHGCLCILCRQARAVRHLRRLPGCLELESHGERLLIDAGIAELGRRLSQDPVETVLLTSWHPARWLGLVPVHLGNGRETGILGPQHDEGGPWLLRQPGRLLTHAVLKPGVETLAGRFRILPLSLDDGLNAHHERQLAYCIRDGEQRLAYIPAVAGYDPHTVQAINDWQPDAVVTACPASGSPRLRLEKIQQLHEQLGCPALLLTGLDHHMDQWLQSNNPSLPDGFRIARDQQKLETHYLAEYQRLARTEPELHT
jgi:phosphoribosyl 1,2-cyclic phosphate phosphodiesterase